MLHVLFKMTNALSESSSFVQEKILKWPPQPPTNKIDTHHHFVPDFYAKAVKEEGGDPSGWPTPEWSVTKSEAIMARLGVQTAILSVTAPGACIKRGKESFDLARKLNEHAAAIRDSNPEKFGFFASLPSLLNTKAALAEMKFALDDLHADGITLFTRYGDGNAYLGHASIEPIWAELDRRRAVVFVHPTHPVDTTRVNAKMPQPMIDYPHETTRTAMDMIMAGTRKKYPNCTVILSHAGGALPYLISRFATPLRKVPSLAASATTGTNHEQAMADFRSFHYDLALSTSPSVLKMVLDAVPHEQILYGVSSR